jgi:hypothetical protein
MCHVGAQNFICADMAFLATGTASRLIKILASAF